MEMRTDGRMIAISRKIKAAEKAEMLISETS